ncbi:hypothetical protein F7725_024085 [Dissostichus mawsoni]|uniref:Uncharacterized protein n=1 Tax=Dissostichus mawsoni TaxID=36200 RepID=A0A7J5XYC4_DISMA|nr:hypothetical protein F7725_024085 [Dissostichus mawsoni]
MDSRPSEQISTAHRYTSTQQQQQKHQNSGFIKLCGAGAIRRCPPCVSVLANLLNSAGVETLVRPGHIENLQPVHLSLRFLKQTLHNQKLRGLECWRRRDGEEGGGARVGAAGGEKNQRRMRTLLLLFL